MMQLQNEQFNEGIEEDYQALDDLEIFDATNDYNKKSLIFE